MRGDHRQPRPTGQAPGEPAPGPPPAPPRKPSNPVVHPLAPGVEMTIDRAVTAPVELAEPMALAHFPTARSEEDAVVRSVNVVEEVSVTTTLDVFLVTESVSSTVTVDPLTAVTVPRRSSEPSGPAAEVAAGRPGPPAFTAEAARRASR